MLHKPGLLGAWTRRHRWVIATTLLIAAIAATGMIWKLNTATTI